MKRLQKDALEATAQSEAQRIEREDLENRLAEAEVRAPRLQRLLIRGDGGWGRG